MGPTNYGMSFAPRGSIYIKTEHDYNGATEVWELPNGRKWYIPLPTNISVQSQAAPALPGQQINIGRGLSAWTDPAVPTSSIGPVDMSHLEPLKASGFRIGDRVVYEGRVGHIKSTANDGSYMVEFMDSSINFIKEERLKLHLGSRCECGAKYTTFADSHMHFCPAYVPGGEK